MDYDIYTGESNGAPVRVLISKPQQKDDVKEQGRFESTDYFSPSVSNVEHTGTVTIEGDLHYLDLWFELKN